MHASFGAETTEILGFEVTTSIDAVAEAVDAQRPDLAPVASPEGTLTLMFTDLEASTATNEAMGDEKFLPLLLRHHAIVEDHTRSAGGTVVKSQGDGFMLAFPSARRGVDCAIAVQRDVTALDERLKVRMGLHTGEPVRHSDDFFGRDVAYAARVGSAANGREILVSSLVKSLVEPSGSYTFDGPRELELKGFDGPQPIYTVRWDPGVT
jgi:class 3 adenylate cyclase